MYIKGALFKNTLGALLSRGSTLLVRLVQIPMLLTALGVDDYGKWLVLSSLPTWITLTNLGFGSAASNEISIAVASGDDEKARSAYSTSLYLMIIVAVIGSIIIIFVVQFIRWEEFVNLSSKRHEELTLTIIWLSITVLFSFSAEVFGGKLRAARKTHICSIINSLRTWIDLVLMFIVLQYSKRFDYLAISLFCSLIIYLIILIKISGKLFPSLSFSLKLVNTKRFSYLFKKGMAFQAFPLGNAIVFQGNILIIQTFFGSSIVALYGTIRTLVRSINQVLELSNQIVGPELSLLLGAGELKKAARLHRVGVSVSTLIAGICIITLLIFGQTIFNLWIGKSIIIAKNTLLLFLATIPLYTLWYTSSIVHTSFNKPEGLAMRYLVGAVISMIICVVFAYCKIIEGVILSTIITDLILIPYVLKHSLALTNDNLLDFIKGSFGELIFIKNKLKLRIF